MADVADKEVQAVRPPELPKELPAPGPSSRLTVTLVSLAALAIVGAATANSLPNHEYISLPKFDSFAMPKLDSFAMPKLDVALPKLDWPSWPTFKRTASQAPKRQPPTQTVSIPIPDPIVRAILRDVQTTQDQHTASLAALTQNAEMQQADMRKISRQLNALTGQVSALHGAMGPLTTGSIPAQTNPRARLLRPARRTAFATPETLPIAPTPALPKPVGPVSIGGAPLGSSGT